jgi:hypothetical protein
MTSEPTEFFIGVYTHQVKAYCDRAFFRHLYELSRGHRVHIVDNSPTDRYVGRLIALCRGYEHFRISKIDVPTEPVTTLFLRNVCSSANSLRDEFLRTECRYFVTIESDVMPPVDVIGRFSARMTSLPDNWGVFGAVYYSGRHDFSMRGIHSSDLVFSGCSVYKRELIEKCRFRWSEEFPRTFPDAWMSTDAVEYNYSLWNDHDIRCDHLQSKSEHDLATLVGNAARKRFRVHSYQRRT